MRRAVGGWGARGQAAGWGVLLLLLFLLGPATPASAQAPSLEEAARQLDEAAARLEDGDLSGARATIERLDSVQAPEGEEIALESAAWLRLLDEQPEEASRVLREAASALRDPTSTLPTDARERLARILARAEFQPVQPSLWDRLIRWLAARLPRFDRIPGAAGASEVLIWLVTGISVLVLAALLFSFLRGLRQSVSEGEALDELHAGMPLDAADAQQRASEAASAGDFREAMRLLYLAALLHLDEVGLIRFDRALTNREVLATVRDDTRLRPLLAPVIHQFDRVWYGHAPFGAAEFERVSGQLDQLRRLEQ